MGKILKRWGPLLLAVYLIFKSYDKIFNKLQEISVLLSTELTAYEAGFLFGKILVLVIGCAAGIYLWEKFKTFQRLKALNNN